MNDTEREATLDRLREFVAQERQAGELADSGSLERAADVVALYEDRAWVRDVAPPKTRRNRGRPVDPESFSRFTKWLTEQIGLAGRTAYQLRDAHTLQANYLRGAQIMPTGEWALRPLRWLDRHDHGEAVPAVWDRACELAGGRNPKSPDVRKALAEWKRDNLPKVDRKSTSRGGRVLVDRWLRDAHRIMEEYPELFIDAINRVEEDAERLFVREEQVA